MTPDTCPHCGARETPRDHFRLFACGTSISEFSGKIDQSSQCARYVRTRISQLKRMIADADVIFKKAYDVFRVEVARRSAGHPHRDTRPLFRRVERLGRFIDTRESEIDRLRGGA